MELDAPALANVLYADAMTFRAAGGFLIFDAIDALLGVTHVLAGDLTTGRLETVDVLLGQGTAPVYAGDDTAVVYGFSRQRARRDRRCLPVRRRAAQRLRHARGSR